MYYPHEVFILYTLMMMLTLAFITPSPRISWNNIFQVTTEKHSRSVIHLMRKILIMSLLSKLKSLNLLYVTYFDETSVKPTEI